MKAPLTKYFSQRGIFDFKGAKLLAAAYSAFGEVLVVLLSVLCPFSALEHSSVLEQSFRSFMNISFGNLFAKSSASYGLNRNILNILIFLAFCVKKVL
jgi:hypothetical protein